jgi:hypothetical protein
MYVREKRADDDGWDVGQMGMDGWMEWGGRWGWTDGGWWDGWMTDYDGQMMDGSMMDQ